MVPSSVWLISMRDTINREVAKADPLRVCKNSGEFSRFLLKRMLALLA
jgi:hypothetical protein